jgi:hypothetical protein
MPVQAELPRTVRRAVRATTIALAASLVAAACSGPALAAGDRSASFHERAQPRTIVTTDPELDDLNSMLHLLLYSNEIRIEGLVYSASRHHWSGDGNGTTYFHEDRGYDEPRTEWRWKPGQSHIEDALDAYELAYPNLRRHDRRYPAPRSLRSKYRVGNIEFEGDTAEETPGSRLIERVLLDHRPGRVVLQAWGGPNTIARALMSIEDRYKGTRAWPAIYRKVSDKAIITQFSAQDDTYRDYISPHWPEVEVRDLATTTWGYFAFRTVLPEDQHYLQPGWMSANISSVGPMGALYRVWGDGRQMSPGDREDYFGLFGYTADELRAMGYVVWIEPRPKGSWISEGDSSNWAILIDNGLRNHEDATWGGWGSRAEPTPDNPRHYSSDLAVDATPSGEQPDDYKTARWFSAMMNDFAARMQWTVTPHRRWANHEPSAEVLGGLDIDVAPGETVRLHTRVSDPDGDAVTARWWQYREAGSYEGDVAVSDIVHRSRSRGRATLTVPGDAQRGQTIHLILEVTDDGAPALTSYQRVVATVR